MPLSEYSQCSKAWEERTEHMFRFWVEGQCMGVMYGSQIFACYNEPTLTLSIDFQPGTLMVNGPKTWEFYSAFCANKATELKADGVDILFVRFVVRTQET